jgi:hypothetical protein
MSVSGRVYKQCLSLYYRLLVSSSTRNTTQTEEMMKCRCHQTLSLSLIDTLVFLWCQVVLKEQRLYSTGKMHLVGILVTVSGLAQTSSKNLVRKLLRLPCLSIIVRRKPSPFKSIKTYRYEARITHMPARIADPSSPTNKVRTIRTSMGIVSVH